MSFDENKSLLDASERVRYDGCVISEEVRVNEDKAVSEEVIEEKKVEKKNDGGGLSPWFVVLASFLCICVLDGTMYSFGSFLEALMSDMKQRRGTVSIAGSLQVAVSAFAGPPAASLVRRYGPRYVCVSGAVTATFGLVLASFSSNLVGIFIGQSLLTGLGFGLMYIPAVVAVAERFKGRERGGLALGLALCGAGAGQVGVAPLVSALIESMGWRWALRVLAVIALGCAATGLLMRTGPEEEVIDDTEIKTEVDEPIRRPILSLILGPKIANTEHLAVFLLSAVGDCLAVMALYIPYSYLGGVAEAKGVPPSLTALLISAVGVGSVAGRLLSGWLCDQPWCHPLALTRAAISLTIGIPFLMAWVDHLWMLLALCLMFGLLTGHWISATSPLLVKLLGISQLSQAFGLLTAVRGLAALASPPLAGLLVDMTGAPTIALHLSGGLLIGSAAVYTMAIFVFNRRKRMHVMYEKL